MTEQVDVASEVPKNGNEEPAPEETVNNAEYIKQLMREKLSLEPESNSITMKLLDKELAKAQKGKNYAAKPVHDVLRDRPIRASVKISLPIKEYPRFNFVGKLLGPRGSTLKKLQEETMTKMAILGRGSMRDKTKEEECKESLDPKYSHLSDDLHIEIFANGPPAEAYARLAYALVELRKHLTPDDEAAPPSGLGGPDLGPRSRPGPGPGPGPGPRPAPGGPPFRGGPQRGANKVMSILDRARMSMDGGYGQYEEGPPAGYGYEAYDNGPAGGYGPDYGPPPPPPPTSQWKGYGPPKVDAPASRFGHRPTPYGRK